MDNPSANKPAGVLEKLLFTVRAPWLIVFLLLTLFLGYHASQVRPDASLSKMIPTNHPFIQNYFDYQDDLASLGNVVRVAVENKDGDIFEADFQRELQKITDEIFFIPGVNRSGLRSLWTPNVRWMEVTEEGFVGGPVIPDGYDGSEESLDQLRTNVLRSGEVGNLVANNFESTIVYIPLDEVNPETGEKLDYQEFSEKLETLVRDKYQSEDIEIHITGFAKLIGDLIEGAEQVGLFFLLAIAITLVMLYFYSRCWRSTFMVLSCSIIAVIWQLGIIELIGSGINPYSMLVPFLVFAIGVSHGVQIINAIGTNRVAGLDKVAAARTAFRGLYIAGLTALASDAIGFTTLMVIDIEVIKELAIAASIGVAVVVLTNLGLLPILMSYLGTSDNGVAYQKKIKGERHPLFDFFAKFTQPKWAYSALVVALIMLAWGLVNSQNMAIGDLDKGAPELRPDSRYNQDNAFIVENYSSSTDIFVVMAASAPEQCIAYDNLEIMERFSWHMENTSGVQDVKSVVYVSKMGMFGINEGNLKWFSLNRNKYVTNASLSRIPDGLINNDCSMAPVIIYLDDHKAETLKNVVGSVNEFNQNYQQEGLELLMAAGNSGIEAATNSVIEAAQNKMLLWVYGVVIVLCFITFRSVRTVACIVLPLAFTTVMSQGLMAVLGIGIKVATLPVIALGVGIGVDYGIYIYSKVKEGLQQGMSLQETYKYSLDNTGKAVGFTGLTLAIGVATWIFSPIKFQADMGILLTFMFLWNMLGALILIPALARLFRVGNKKA
ncbi:RND family transporter [Idiomarina loihiensis]|uniref:efflux RND transporter permease subunit n=1 Tax=Idiomarina TaxID=135575 RepID=UPI000307038D|nr:MULTISPECIES: MMPL family transporter [Idiomarina]MRJ44009.1 MMPL family transporter [Idiomarina loihiensis]NWO02850.1 RND family transporter [Idiomarinaceae bacterium]UTW33863.1 RND family transporter [Idiomarina loihiensis]